MARFEPKKVAPIDRNHWHKSNRYIQYREKLNKDRFLDEKILAKWYGDKGSLHCIYVAEIVQLLEKQ